MNKPSVHVIDRIAACMRAYYSMQGAGFCNVTTNANMIGYLWESAIRPVLLYGSSSVHINKESMLKMRYIRFHSFIHSGETFGHKDLIYRGKLTCKKYGISFMKYIFADTYSPVVRKIFTKECAIQNGLTDSVRLLLKNNNPQNRILLNLMLRAF